MQTTPVDAGVPQAVADVLSRVLCQLGCVTFLSSLSQVDTESADWSQHAEGWTRVLRPAGRDWLRRKPAFPLVCTMTPHIAEQLFSVEQFAWELRSQLVLLFSATAPPPLVTYDQVCALFEGRVSNYQQLAAELKADGFIFPGVGGDFVEFVVFEEKVWKNLQETLSQECEAGEISWRTVSEQEFENMKWVV